MSQDKNGYVYMMSNPHGTVIYTGVTSELRNRIYKHRNKLIPGFTKKYNAINLVYYEIYDSVVDAITREKQIKGWVRKKKVALIKSRNPKWLDLYETLLK